MTEQKGSRGKSRKKNRAIHTTVIDDFLHGDLQRSFHRDFKELYHFYLDEEDLARLAKMGRIRRFLSMTWWLLKGLILKLPPLRRLLLLLALLLLLFQDISWQTGDVRITLGTSCLSILIVLVILMLELKDKLLARDELEVGRAVQLALMPQACPEVPGWDVWLFTAPANDVGGDLVDCLKTGEHRWGIALGDVSGKGLGAALLMAKLQSTLRALSTDYESLADLGYRVNRILCRDSVPGRFATLAYLEVWPDSGAVHLLNAGHMPPILLREGRLESLEPVAPVLGFLPDAAYMEQEVDLAPGDYLVVYSDGVTEAKNGKDEFFGEERLRTLLPILRGLPPEQLGGRLLTEVRRFIGDERPSDDLSLVILRRVG